MQIVDLNRLTEISKKENRKDEFNKFRPMMEANTTTIEVFPRNTIALAGGVHTVKGDKFANFYSCLKGHKDCSCEICGAMVKAHQMVGTLAKEAENLVTEDKKEETRKRVYREEITNFENEFFSKSEPYAYIACVEIDANYKKNGNVLTPRNMTKYSLNGEEIEAPAFQIKIKRMRVSALTKLKESFETDGYTMQGGVLFTKYGNETNKMLLGKNKVQQVLDLNIFKDYPKMMEVIEDSCNKTFNVSMTEDSQMTFDTTIFSEVYPELKMDRRPYKFEETIEKALGKWMKFQEHLKLNPDKTFTSFRVENSSVTPNIPEVPATQTAPEVPLNTTTDIPKDTVVKDNGLSGITGIGDINMENYPF